MKVGVIGGGAAGFFAAIHVKENYPACEVSILEKSTKVLSKVKISGGGRCNVTNGTTSLKELVEGYPRGSKKLKKLFKVWNNKHTIEWFESNKVKLKTEADNRVFPVSDDSQSIIDCLTGFCTKHNIKIQLQHQVTKISESEDGINLFFKNGESTFYDKVIIASGGYPKSNGFDWLRELEHEIVEPVPSLFTFNMPDEHVISLQGLTTSQTLVSIEGLKYKSTGPLLITHWGMSGPSILRLSSLAARDLFERNYAFKLKVNWIGITNEEQVFQDLSSISNEHPKKLLRNVKPFSLQARLWSYLVDKAQLPSDKVWSELGKKGIYKLIKVICNDIYDVSGKTTFKEEFVTCGGVSLDSIDMRTMRSNSCNNLYFAGEVIDIDGITGGYNFQAAWTTGYVAAQLA